MGFLWKSFKTFNFRNHHRKRHSTRDLDAFRLCVAAQRLCFNFSRDRIRASRVSLSYFYHFFTNKICSTVEIVSDVIGEGVYAAKMHLYSDDSFTQPLDEIPVSSFSAPKTIKHLFSGTWNRRQCFRRSRASHIGFRS